MSYGALVPTIFGLQDITTIRSCQFMGEFNVTNYTGSPIFLSNPTGVTDQNSFTLKKALDGKFPPRVFIVSSTQTLVDFDVWGSGLYSENFIVYWVRYK
jgi:hypothetical protein